MSASAVIYALLAASAPLAALVADRIYPERLPKGKPLKGCSYRVISRRQSTPVSLATNQVVVICRVEVTCQVTAGDYVGLNALVSAVHAACVNRSGSIGGVQGVVVTDAGQGPQMRDDDRGISEQAHDFMVTYRAGPLA